MNQTFTLDLSHRVYYSNREPIPIAEIATSLLALEKLLQRMPKVLSLVTDVPIEGFEVFVDDIHSGSLIEDIIIKVFFKDQAGLDAFLGKIHEQLGQRKVTRNLLIAAILMAIVGYGLHSAATVMGSDEAKQAININNNVIINIAADQAGMKPEQLVDIIKASITDKKANARDAIEFVKPAKRDPEASISMEGQQVVSITSDVVKKSPSSLNIEDVPTERLVPDVDLQIRATNRDSQTSGWAGLIPNLIDRRVRLVLSEEVKPEQLAGKFTVRADVIIHSKAQGPKKEISPYMITVVRVIE